MNTGDARPAFSTLYTGIWCWRYRWRQHCCRLFFQHPHNIRRILQSQESVPWTGPHSESTGTPMTGARGDQSFFSSALINADQGQWAHCQHRNRRAPAAVEPGRLLHAAQPCLVVPCSALPAEPAIASAMKTEGFPRPGQDNLFDDPGQPHVYPVTTNSAPAF